MEDKEIAGKLKNSKTIEELKDVAKEIGYELTDDEAKAYFDEFAKSGELADDELANVSGGACAWWRKGRAYRPYSPYYLIVTVGNSCKLFRANDKSCTRKTCPYCYYHTFCDGPRRYCGRRTYYDDPLNP